MKTKFLSTIPPEVLSDAPQHVSKLVELQRALAESSSEYLQAAQFAKECKKQVDADQTKFNNYVKDLTEEKMFDKKQETEVKHAKTEPVELKPVWPFPLPESMRSLTLDDVSKRDEVKGLSAMIVGSARDKGYKTAGDVEDACGGSEKTAKQTDHAATAIRKLLEQIGQRQGTVLLNALADVKAKWVEEAKKPEGWPFPVVDYLADHSISQVANKYPKCVTTAAAGKLVEADITTIGDLNEKLADGDSGFLVGIIGPGPAKKLIDAIAKYVAEEGE